MALLDNFKEIGRDFKKIGKDIGTGGGDGIGQNFKKLGKDIGVTAVKTVKKGINKASDWADNEDPTKETAEEAAEE